MTVGSTIKVYDAHIHFNKSLAEHIKKNGYQGAPAPIFQQYKGASQPEDKVAIVFLNRLDEKSKKFRFTMSGSIEIESKLGDIKAQIFKVDGPL